MITFEDAYRIVLDSARPLLTEPADFTRCANRVLAQDIVATMDMPPFDKAMVDGYACHRSDLENTMELVETIPAGQTPKRTLNSGECAKIMTGAMIPEGADCVFMVEQSADEDGVVRFTGERTGDNIARQGHDVSKGDMLLPAGHRMSAHDIAVLASMGHTRPHVYCQPSVGIIATGDELVEPELVPGPAQIRNSNAYHLSSQLESLGLRPSYEGIARDDAEYLSAKIENALLNNDVVLISGGVSMGDYDFVPEILRRHNVEIKFNKVAVQPGKPTVFGQSDSTSCFGLPGNPVSSYIIFELFVKPFLFKMMGHEYTPPMVMMPLGEPLTRKSGAREAWVPVVLTTEGAVHHVEYHGSAHITALSHADGLTRIPKDVTELATGTVVPVRLIRT